MKAKRVAVFVENKSGKFYQVILNSEEMNYILGALQGLHRGAIKVRKEQYPFNFEENDSKNKKPKKIS